MESHINNKRLNKEITKNSSLELFYENIKGIVEHQVLLAIRDAKNVLSEHYRRKILFPVDPVVIIKARGGAVYPSKYLLSNYQGMINIDVSENEIKVHQILLLSQSLSMTGPLPQKQGPSQPSGQSQAQKQHHRWQYLK